MSQEILLDIQSLTKEFKGFVAVNDVSLNVTRGSIHALIGPNGAGKTTLFNLLTNFLVPTRGNVFFKGVNITHEKPAQIARRGIVRSFQISAVFPHMSVLENVRVALQQKQNVGFNFWQSEKSLHHLHSRALELLDSVDLHNFADELAVNLPYGRKRALELATTLALEPELMLLDEPTQGMGHNMNVVSSIADRITVLQRGTVIADGTYRDVSKNPLVIEAYMGSTDNELVGAH